jgi:pyrrolidone-carboxylate peptidase
MTVSRLQTQLQTLTAHGRKLSGEDVRKLVGLAKDGAGVDAKELAALKKLAPDAFEAGAHAALAAMLGGTQSAAYVNIAAPTAPADSFARAGKTGTPGVTLRTEDGAGQLTQNCFWLEGKATAAGKLALAIDGKTVTIAARKGETAGALGERLGRALPKGYSVQVNTAFPGKTQAQLQVFKVDPVPAALVQPVLDGKQPPVKVLITGYGKFGQYATDDANPAWQLAKKAAQQAYPGAQVEAVLLPVEWSKVEQFTQTVKDQYHPDVVISLGAGPHGLEVWGQNLTDGEDAAGVSRSNEKALEGGPDFLKTTLPVRDIEAAEARLEDQKNGGGLVMHASQTGTLDERLAQAKQFQIDASNTYLCNYLNYRMIEATQKDGIMSGFVHVDETTSPQELAAVVQQSVLAQLKKRAATSTTPTV